MGGSFGGVCGLLAAPVMAALNADMERAAVELAEPEDGQRYVVIGFGAGVGLRVLLDTVDPEFVLGVDPSAVMHGAAGRRLSRHHRRDRVELVKARSSEIPPDVAADAVLAVNNQQLWQPHRDSVAAISRALRSGGHLVTLTHRWAITKTQSVDAWKTQVESDLAATGFAPPTWRNASYRSGRALAMLARKEYQLGMDSPAVRSNASD